ncbi:cell division protein FtsQ/DivIB [Calothrix sp. UHCC 0171]|uniref:cell division protein FtsQ/DivIB n=1 Tax=Calothrix sp. UHCC 0171 TaxID=3110245 RepID=UPI002B1EB441|nr:FtsQ-type POTRA domain-containing protein [Calothrix sp. UHCC 0171]MEA5571333.1 FtsQ-type POTRA domain-containing protein [Calothrix sp. UHCC 0171]
MTDIASVSRTDLTQRRNKLRRQRRVKIIQRIWQTVAVSGLAGTLLWGAIQPHWVIKAAKDIEVSGNQLLSNEAVQSRIALSYPQSMWKIEPSQIAESLQKQPAIARANVSRRLLPPGLVVEIQERIPVAIAVVLERNGSDEGVTEKTLGLLDITGTLIPADFYSSSNVKSKLPTLKVIGVPEQYRQFWAQFYQTLSRSSVKITEIDWRDPSNLILKTELGQVHLGTPNSLLPEKFKVLLQMAHLPAQVNTDQIEYIDLKDPDSPTIQISRSTNALKKQRLNP